MEIQDFLLFWDDKIIGISCFLYLEIKNLLSVGLPVACCWKIPQKNY